MDTLQELRALIAAVDGTNDTQRRALVARFYKRARLERDNAMAEHDARRRHARLRAVQHLTWHLHTRLATAQ